MQFSEPMEETTVNRLNGVPFWGHGTMENLENGITPTTAEEIMETPVEVETETVVEPAPETEVESPTDE